MFSEGAEFLIITCDTYYPQACSLAEWKYSKGISTKVTTLSEIDPEGAPTKEEIKAYILNAYNYWDPKPRYLLLIGNATEIPKWNLLYVNCTDNQYGDMEGDYHAEIAVGRFAVDSMVHCRTVIAKTINYEKNPWMSDSNWFHSATLILRQDSGDNSPYYATCDYINGELSSYWNPYGHIDYFIDVQGDDRDSVINAVNEGRALVVYRGPSGGQAWYSPFNFNPNSLSNGWKLPIVISGTCLTGSFSSENALCKAWVHAGSETTPKGAVAFMGTSTTSPDIICSWNRHYVTVGIFNGIYLYDYDTLGRAFVSGKDEMTQQEPVYAEKEYYGWSLIGDPTLMVWTDTPKTLTVTINPMVIEMDNMYDIIVTVKDQASQQPIQNACVVLYRPGITVDDPEIFESSSTNANGIDTFYNFAAATAGKVKVTVTYHSWDINYIPYQDEISVFEIMTDDPNALAYNGNRHLVREIGNDKLHITYTDNGHVFYRYSTDFGINWSMREDVGSGSYPCITLGPLNVPAIAWTNTDGDLYFAKKNGASWQSYQLYHPVSPNPKLNSPPVIDINSASKPAKVNILVTLTGQGTDPVPNIVRHYSFSYDSPSGTYTTIDSAYAPKVPLRRHSPTLVRNELDNTLHAAWMRVDTICYALKSPVGFWTIYNNPFVPTEGIRAAHPFIESYGDSIYLVWQDKASPSSPEEIWRGRRGRVQPPNWYWWNHSYTPTTISVNTVNASGLYTVFMDESESTESFDIFMKIYWDGTMTNLSQSMNQSYYPQSVAKFTPITDYLYTLYQEGISSPCEIKFNRYDPSTPRGEDDDIAYLSSFSGDSMMSPYLTARDGYHPDWQITTDYGYQQLTYRFPMDPAYLYKAKVIAYQERTGQWKAACRIDNTSQMLIKYSAHVPETLTFWIPTNLYQDSVIEVTLNRIAGDFVSMGQIYVYRYEPDSKVAGGPQSSDHKHMNKNGLRLSILPNPAVDEITIAYTLSCESDVTVKVYDAAGRMVNAIKKGVQMPGNYRESLRKLNLPRGIYFVRLTADNETVTAKAVFLK